MPAFDFHLFFKPEAMTFCPVLSFLTAFAGVTIGSPQGAGHCCIYAHLIEDIH